MEICVCVCSSATKGNFATCMHVYVMSFPIVHIHVTHASNFSLCHDSSNLCFSSRADFEASLIQALRALFCSPEGVPVAVLRFWMLLSVKLLTNLDPQIFPKISIKFQVNPSHTKEY